MHMCVYVCMHMFVYPNYPRPNHNSYSFLYVMHPCNHPNRIIAGTTDSEHMFALFLTLLPHGAKDAAFHDVSGKHLNQVLGLLVMSCTCAFCFASVIRLYDVYVRICACVE